MSQADALLNSLTDEQIALYSGTGVSEPHIVIGSDRKITVPDSLKRIAVETDHNVETVTFDCPRYWDNHDLSKMILYINVKLPNGSTISHIAENITAVEGASTFTFTWTITRTITAQKGNLIFLVCAKKTETIEGEPIETVHWNTELCNDMYVSEGLEADLIVEEEYPDIVNQLLERMTVVEGINVSKDYIDGKVNTAQTAADDAEDYKNTASGYLAEFEDIAAEIRNSYANAIKGNVSGEIVRVDDVSPLEHDVDIWVHSKNLIPYPYSDTTKTSNGITFTDNGDGSVTANGTATGNGVFYFINHENDFYVDGDVYLSGCPEGGSFTGTGYSLRLNKYVGGSEVSGIVDTGNGRAGTFNNEQIRVYLVILAGTTVENLTVKPMLEYGTSTTGYMPYIDPSTITVKRCDKNLFPYPFEGTTYTNGITFTDNKNGSVTLTGINDGSSNSVFYLTKDSYITIPAGTYSCTPNVSGISIMGVEKGGGYFTFCSVNKKQFTLSETTTFRSIYIQILKGSTNEFSNVKIWPMLEYGSTDAVFEMYNCKNGIPDENGVCVVKSLCPTMTIFTDTPGAIVDVTYNRDTTKMFESYVLTENAKNEIAGLVKDDISAEIDAIEDCLDEIIAIQESLL